MNRTKLFATVLGMVLIVSLTVNVYFAIENTSLQSKAKQLEMISFLTQVQSQVTSELKKIGVSVTYAAQQLSITGLDGDQASSILTELAANSSFIIDALTADADNNLVTVMPQTYSNLTGTYLGNPDYINTNYRANIEPTLTPVMPLVEGFDGAVIFLPIFNSDKQFIGTVNVAFKPSLLFNEAVSSVLAGTPYALWAMQTNGLVLYDSAHPDEVGLMLFSDSTLTQYPETLAVMHRIVNEQSGHATYQYPLTPGSEQLVNKDTQWKTIGGYGSEWRLAIVQTVNL